MDIEIFIQSYLVDYSDLCQFIKVFPLIVSVDPTGTIIHTLSYIHYAQTLGSSTRHEHNLPSST